MAFLLHKQDYRSIFMFFEVAELLSFTKAAERLNVSQPAVTFQISKLEKAVGAALFDRIHNTIKLTTAGEIMYGFKEKFLALHTNLETTLSSLSGVTEFRLMVPMTYLKSLLIANLSSPDMEPLEVIGMKSSIQPTNKSNSFVLRTGPSLNSVYLGTEIVDTIALSKDSKGEVCYVESYVGSDASYTPSFSTEAAISELLDRKSVVVPRAIRNQLAAISPKTLLLVGSSFVSVYCQTPSWYKSHEHGWVLDGIRNALMLADES